MANLTHTKSVKPTYGTGFSVFRCRQVPFYMSTWN